MGYRKEFQTAAARRREDPIVWVIDGNEIHMNPAIEFGDLAGMIDVAGQAATEAQHDETTNVETGGERLRAVQEKVDALRNELAQFVSPETQDAYAKVRGDLDLGILLELIQDITAEVSGRVPTLPSGSPDGSPPPGPSSTDGAPAAV